MKKVLTSKRRLAEISADEEEDISLRTTSEPVISGAQSLLLMEEDDRSKLTQATKIHDVIMTSKQLDIFA